MPQPTDQLPLWVIVVTSASVAAFISTGLTLFGQWRERIARGKELLLSKAIEVAIKHVDVLREYGTTNEWAMYDFAAFVELNHSRLKDLVVKGELADEVRPHPLSPRGKATEKAAADAQRKRGTGE